MARLMSFSKRLLFATTLVSVFAACGHKDDTSSMSVAFPDWGKLRQQDVAKRSSVSTLATDANTISMIVVNVSGGGLTAPLVSIWNASDSNSTPPTQVSFSSVPMGSGRLVQVLAVYQGSGLDFYYADQTINMNSTTTDVPALTLTNQAVALNLVQGNLVGRFYDASGTTGYTGQFNYLFNPPIGAPPMIVHTGEMYAGWASVFSLSSPLLTQALPNGQPLFATNINNNDNRIFSPNYASAVAPGVQAARVFAPTGYKVNSNNNTLNISPQGAQYNVVGFFGNAPGGSTLYMSSGSASTLVNSLYSTLDGSGNPQTQMVWRGSGYSPPSPNTNNAYVMAGGQATGSCSAANEFVSCMTYKGQNLNSGSDAMGFRPPFQRVSTSSGYNNYVGVQFSVANGGSLIANWKFLPGVAGVSGTPVVYYKTMATQSAVYNDSDIRPASGDGYGCAQLPSLGYSTATVSGSTATITNLGGNAALTRVVVCPTFGNNVFMQAGVMGYLNTNTSGGISTSSVPATQLTITGPDNLPAISSGSAKLLGAGSCIPISINPTLADGVTPGYLASSSPMNLTITAPSPHKLFTDAACTGTGVASFNFPSYYGSQKPFYLKIGSNSSTTVSLTSTVTGSANGLTLPAYFFKDISASGDTISLNIASTIYAHSCIPAELIISKSSSAGSITGAGVSDTITIPSTTGISYYTDANCTTALSGTTVAVSTGDVVKNFSVKYVGTASTLTPSDLAFTASNLTVSASPTITVVQPGAPARVRLSLASQVSVQAGQCVPLIAQLVDINGYPTGNPNASPIGLSIGALDSTGAVSGQFGYSTSCSTATTNGTLNFSQGSDSQTNLSYKVSTSPQGPILIGLNSFTSSPSFPVDFTALQIGSQTIAAVKVGLAADTWSSTTLSYTSATKTQVFEQGFSYSVGLKAVSGGGILAASYSGTAASVGFDTSPTGKMTLVSPLTWTNGSATAQVIFSGSNPAMSIVTGGGATALTAANTANFIVLPPATALSLIGGTAFKTGVCEPMLVNLTNVASSITTVAHALSNTTVTFTVPTGVHAFSDGTCAAGSDITSSGLTIPTGGSASIVYFKSTSTASGSVTLHATGLTDATTTLTVSSGTLGNSTQLTYLGATNFLIGACQPVTVAVTDSAGARVTDPGSAMSVQISGNSSDLLLHAVPDCSDAGAASTTLTMNLAATAAQGTTGIFYVQSLVSSDAYGLSITDVSSTASCGTGSSACTTVTPSLNIQ